jgi:hypothetical protein
MTASGSKTYLVVVADGGGDRSFTVSGLSSEELRQLLVRAGEGRPFKVAEVDTQVVQNHAISHLLDASGTLAVVFIVTALLVRRLKSRRQR